MAANVLQVCPRDCLFEVLRCLNTRELLVFTGVSQTTKDLIRLGYDKLPISRWTQLEYTFYTTFGLRIPEKDFNGISTSFDKIPTTLKRSISECTFQIGPDFDYKKYDSYWIEDFKQLNTIIVHCVCIYTKVDACWFNKIMATTCAKKIVLPSQCWINASLECFPSHMTELVINFSNTNYGHRIFSSDYVVHTVPVDIILNFKELRYDADYWINYHLYDFSLRFESIRKLDLRSLVVDSLLISSIACEEVSQLYVPLTWNYILNASNYPGKKKVYLLLDHQSGFSLEAHSSTITHMYLTISCETSNVGTKDLYDKWVAFLTQVIELKHNIIPNIQFIELVISNQVIELISDYDIWTSKSPKFNTHKTISGVELHVKCGYLYKSNFHI